MIAIILAAGCGRRIKTKKPKGMLNIGNKPLIQYSIEYLHYCGIKQTIIVTGFGAAYYEHFFSTINTDMQITLLHNVEFARSGSLYSLYLALRSLNIHDDLIILESDILYNIDEFEDFIEQPFQDSVLSTTVPEGRYDACYIEMDPMDNILKITKNINYISKQRDEFWEFIGITKSCSSSIPDLINYAEIKFASNGSIDHEYDYSFESLTRKYKAIKYRDYVWSEADDNEQLHYMVTNVYPKLNLYYNGSRHGK